MGRRSHSDAAIPDDLAFEHLRRIAALVKI
jgi:hypothetical protein